MQDQYRFTELLYCTHFKHHVFHKRLRQETETLIWGDEFKNSYIARKENRNTLTNSFVSCSMRRANYTLFKFKWYMTSGCPDCEIFQEAPGNTIPAFRVHHKATSGFKGVYLSQRNAS